jgi:hypothetical protein
LFKYAILAALLISSFGFTSAFADDTFVNSDEISFGQVSQSYLSTPAPTIIDPLTGEAPVLQLLIH